jgi:hypothetical protein
MHACTLKIYCFQSVAYLTFFSTVATLFVFYCFHRPLFSFQASSFAIDPTTAARQTARVTPFLLLLALSALLDHAIGWVTAIVLTAGLVRLQARLEVELKKGVWRYSHFVWELVFLHSF